jgi:hypothetical protein
MRHPHVTHHAPALRDYTEILDIWLVEELGILLEHGGAEDGADDVV